MIFITLLFCNIFLTLVNRSFTHTIFTTIRYKNNLLPLIIGITLLFIIGVLNIPFLRDLFELQKMGWSMIGICAAVAFTGTFWLEIVKAIRHKKPVH
jgi:Ca2+-transporting ATPase